jgi:hypothetical protein
LKPRPHGGTSAWLESRVTLDEVLARLATAARHDPVTLRSRDIPSETGIYVWYVKGTTHPVYIGKACGRRGLRHRIWAQHLNPNYLEWREQKFTEADVFQLGCAVVVRGRRGIYKSVFRRGIGRRERIAPGQLTVDYIRQYFEVAWIVLPQPAVIPLERRLIERLAAEYDLYNRNGNPRGLVSNSAAQLVAPARL